jgi:hypothetical protein
MVRRVAGCIFAACAVLALAPPTYAQSGGPVVLMGIDAEDHWRVSVDGTEGGQHGPIGNYVTLVRELLARTNGTRTGLLILGGGKAANDDVTTFWTRVAADVGQPVTFVHCDEESDDECAFLESVPFAGFALLVVVSDENNTPSGGLTDDENEALAERHDDFATFVNSGGALLGLTSDFSDDEAYGYVAGFGAFEIATDVEPPYRNILPVSGDAAQLGITDALDVCCWHDVFTEFPDFLQVLALDVDVTGRPAAIGGVNVRFPTEPPPPSPPAGPGYMKLGHGRIGNNPVFHQFHLECDAAANRKRFRLKVSWFEDDRRRRKVKVKHEFVLSQITTVACTDDPLIPNPRKANFETHEGIGVGGVDKRPGYQVDWQFVDRGNPGHAGDAAHIIIRTPSGETLLDVSGPLSQGNQKARTRKVKSRI